MRKIVLFNVGGALSAFGEFNGNTFLIDLGKRDEFSPVSDFLIPLAKYGKFAKGTDQVSAGKYLIKQLFLSHLDMDHISDYVEFRKFFHPEYMTCPNNNETQDAKFRINLDLLGELNEIRDLVLRDMNGRSAIVQNLYNMSAANPLVSTIPELSLTYIIPSACEQQDILRPSYANNISLVLFLKLGAKTALLPGDLLKDGIDYLIQSNSTFYSCLSKDGVDYLVAPHHGLQTAFSDLLFKTIKGSKTRLNIISEKTRTGDSTESRSEVDSRYYGEAFSMGKNSLNQRGVKTSMGHIVIDFDTSESDVKQYDDIRSVIAEFTTKSQTTGAV